MSGVKGRDLGKLRAIVTEGHASYVERLVEKWNDEAPREFRDRDLQQLLDPDQVGRGVKGRVNVYLGNPTRWMLLHGPAGVGKTTIAVALVRELVRRRESAGMFSSFIQLTADFSYRPDGRDPVREASRAPLLLLDDVGAMNEGMTPHQQRCLWSVIDARWSAGLLTVMTSNMSLQSNQKGLGLMDWFGESAWDRISSDLTRVELVGKSLRH